MEALPPQSTIIIIALAVAKIQNEQRLTHAVAAAKPRCNTFVQTEGRPYPMKFKPTTRTERQTSKHSWIESKERKRTPDYIHSQRKRMRRKERIKALETSYSDSMKAYLRLKAESSRLEKLVRRAEEVVRNHGMKVVDTSTTAHSAFLNSISADHHGTMNQSALNPNTSGVHDSSSSSSSSEQCSNSPPVQDSTVSSR